VRVSQVRTRFVDASTQNACRGRKTCFLGSPALFLCFLLGVWGISASEITGPLTASSNPNYFKDANGATVILTGSQTWNTFQDWGVNGSVEPLDFDAFVGFLTSHGHNFTLLWITEMPRFCNLPVTARHPPDFVVGPLPWARTGPGRASDGGARFDLTKFDGGFFDRLRTRVQALRKAGIYVGVYLFTGEWLNVFRCSSDGYPLTGTNNINGVDDGYAGGKKGIGPLTMTAPNAVTRFQDAYVERVIDTLNDLPNVLWIVSEEAPANSAWWNDHQISYIRAYEGKKPYQHPIGYAAPIGSPDSVIYSSAADWVAPAAKISPTKSCGSGRPACKVNVNDSDHSNFGMWSDTAQQNRNYAWENFMNGNQVLFMDPYLIYYPRENRNLCASPKNGICSAPDGRWDNFRDNLGYIHRYSRKIKLAKLMPRSSLSSTGFCLANTASRGAEYLVYAPSGGPFTVDLSAIPATRTLSVEWFNPDSGATITGTPISSGLAAQSFTPPFRGDAVLYLVDTARPVEVGLANHFKFKTAIRYH
jgi:Putative collagen-binding domain of a collagenase